MKTNSMSRRAVLAGIAAAPALASPIAALGNTVASDPIFAAIEQHRRAYALYAASLREQEASWDADVLSKKGTPLYDEAFDASEEVVNDAYNVEADALEIMCAMRPTSLFGLASLIEYVCHINSCDRREVFDVVDPYDFIATIRCAVIRAQMAHQISVVAGGADRGVA